MKPPAPITNRRQWPGTSIWISELTEDIPGHPAGSTVSDKTLIAAGYRTTRGEGGAKAADAAPPGGPGRDDLMGSRGVPGPPNLSRR